MDLMNEMLNYWLESTSNLEELPIPLEQQAKKISIKYEVKKVELEMPKFNPDTEETNMELTDCYLVNFKNIICKYRPHLHLGDYWLNVQFSNGQPNYMFYYPLTIDGVVKWQKADHPHLSGGKPCFGSHQGDIADAITSGNYMRFFSQIKAYLSSYYGRSTYVRGTAYKKRKICYSLYSRQEIFDMFAAEYDEPGDMDVKGLAEDPMRWNWPKDIQAWGTIEVQGQELRQFFRMLKVSGDYRMTSLDIEFPFISEQSNWEDNLIQYAYNDRNPQAEAMNKILGYIYLAKIYGEMSLLEATEFVRIFLIKLYLDYTGCIDEDMMKSLKEMSSKLSNCQYRNKWELNRRYTVVLDAKRREESEKLRNELSKIIGEGGTSAKFIKELKFAGHKLSNFMILLRKSKPENATAKGYLWNASSEDIDFLNYRKRYRSIEKFVYTQAMQQLEKDKRRFVNELNKSDIIHLKTDDGQATLFSQDL